MRVFTIEIAPGLCADLQELLPDGGVKTYYDVDEPLDSLLEEIRSCRPKSAVRRPQAGYGITPDDQKVLDKAQQRITDCIRAIAKVPNSESLWVLSRTEAISMFGRSRA